MKLIPVKDWRSVDPNLVAVSLANKSTVDFRLGALITDRSGRIVATGYNKKKTHPRFGSGFCKNLHAEGAALWQASKLKIDVSGYTMFVFRENNNLSKPCKDCQKLLAKAGIQEVYYSSK